jgi:hypothetical protein
MAEGFLNSLKNRIKDNNSGNNPAPKSNVVFGNPFSRQKNVNETITSKNKIEDVIATSKQITPPSKLSIGQIRLVEDIDGLPTFIRVSNFSENGKIRITERYPKINFQEFPTYDLSEVIVLDDVSFKFFLSIKENTNDPNPKVYTSKVFYDELIKTYQEENPYFVSNSIKQEYIINLIVDRYKEKIEELRKLELSLPIQEKFQGGLVISKNLFMNSNYSPDDKGDLVANPTYDNAELVRYVDWVVSKPSANYDDRLLDARSIGSWNSVILGEEETQTSNTTTPEPNEPSNNENTTPAYPPVGRVGSFVFERVFINDEPYYWTGQSWLPYNGDSNNGNTNNPNSNNYGGGGNSGGGS